MIWVEAFWGAARLAGCHTGPTNETLPGLWALENLGLPGFRILGPFFGFKPLGASGFRV